jgi:hypothetical protein
MSWLYIGEEFAMEIFETRTLQRLTVIDMKSAVFKMITIDENHVITGEANRFIEVIETESGKGPVGVLHFEEMLNILDLTRTTN